MEALPYNGHSQLLLRLNSGLVILLRVENSNMETMREWGRTWHTKSGPELTAQEVADMWYQESSDYNYSKPGFSSNTGHFTQMVWANTTHMGAAIAVSGNRSYVVANYTPPGNITNPGQFEQNVKRPK